VQLKKIVLEDSLTGLVNRRHFEEELEHILSLHRKRPLAFAVFRMDLYRFKQVNDSLGHAAGDESLVQVAGAKSASASSSPCTLSMATAPWTCWRRPTRCCMQ